MEAVMSASNAVAAGQRDCIIAGGMESMSRVPMGEGGSPHPRLDELYNVFELQMGMTAEKVAEEYDVSREAQDEYALRSQQRAAEATDSGRFDDEIVPIDTEDGTVTEDEGIRRDTSMEALQGLPTVFREDGTVTPGTATSSTRPSPPPSPCSRPPRGRGRRPPSPRANTSSARRPPQPASTVRRGLDRHQGWEAGAGPQGLHRRDALGHLRRSGTPLRLVPCRP
jgi:hypothetical protein